MESVPVARKRVREEADRETRDGRGREGERERGRRRDRDQDQDQETRELLRRRIDPASLPPPPPPPPQPATIMTQSTTGTDLSKMFSQTRTNPRIISTTTTTTMRRPTQTTTIPPTATTTSQIAAMGLMSETEAQRLAREGRGTTWQPKRTKRALSQGREILPPPGRDGR